MLKEVKNIDGNEQKNIARIDPTKIRFQLFEKISFLCL